MFRKPETDLKREVPQVKSFESLAAQTEKTIPPRPALKQEEEPETILGEEVSFKGELNFQRYLRIDGRFEGALNSSGKLHIGPKGVVKSEIKLEEAIIEGKVEGNLTIQGRLELRSHAQVFGDIQAKSIKVEEGAVIVGIVNIVPKATTAD